MNNAGLILLSTGFVVLVIVVALLVINAKKSKKKSCPTCGKSKEECDCQADKSKCGSCGCN